MAAVIAVAQAVLWGVAILLACIIVLLLVLLFVPSFAKITYEKESFSVVVGILFIQVHVYPHLYFLWDKYADETEEERAARLAKKKEARAKKKPKKQVEKVGDTKAAKGAKLTIDAIVTLLRTAGRVTQLIVGALRIEKIRLQLPVHSNDPAQTAILYGKINAWFYSSIAILDHFIYLDFQEIQITPIFEENFEKTAYFSCKVSAKLFILVIVVIQLFQTLRKEKELLAFFQKGTARKKVS